jgi:hypothetical protein
MDTKLFNITDFVFWLLQLIELRVFESIVGSKILMAKPYLYYKL